METTDLPGLNAALNSLSLLFLLGGYRYIRRGDRQNHIRCMLAALTTSTLFLASYLVYHFEVGSVPYPHQDWTRPLYFAILIPHIILATIIVPFVALLVWNAWKGNFSRHRRLARWTWPAWVFVSFSGVAVYIMLYQL
jgi:putative membrane protein